MRVMAREPLPLPPPFPSGMQKTETGDNKKQQSRISLLSELEAMDQSEVGEEDRGRGKSASRERKKKKGRRKWSERKRSLWKTEETDGRHRVRLILLCSCGGCKEGGISLSLPQLDRWREEEEVNTAAEAASSWSSPRRSQGGWISDLKKEGGKEEEGSKKVPAEKRPPPPQSLLLLPSS